MKSHKTQTKSNKGLYLAVGIIVLAFAYLITKDVRLNPVLTRTVAGMALASLFFISFAKPDLTFYILVAYLPFNKILTGKLTAETAGITITNILIFFCLIAWAQKAAQRKERLFTKAALNLPIIIFIGFGVASLFRGTSFFGTDYAMAYIIPLKRWLTPVFLYFLALNVVRDKQMLKNTVVIMMFVITIAALMCIYEYLDVRTASSLQKSRVGGIAEQANMMGGFFVYYMFLFAGFILINFRKWKYWLLSVPFVWSFIGILTTFSRGAYLGFGFGVLSLAFIRNKFLFLLVTGMTIFLVLNPQYLPAGMAYRMSTTIKNEAIYDTGIEDRVEDSAKERLTIWKGAAEIIKDYPWLGVGYGVFPHVIGFYAPAARDMDAHNTYIIIAAEMGIPALLSFLWILIVLFIHTRRLYRISKDKFIKAMALGFLAGLAGLLVVNMFGSRMDSDEVSTYFWILAGLVFRALLLEKNEIRKAKASVRVR
ncbi:MAG: O-antigen ligase family protein [Candidatus Omnitrophota bacterium]